MELIQTKVSELNCIQIVHQPPTFLRERNYANSIIFPGNVNISVKAEYYENMSILCS